MTRKDYVAAASIVRQAHYLDEEQRVELFEHLCTWFASDNRRFDPDRFFTACAIGDSVRRRVRQAA